MTLDKTEVPMHCVVREQNWGTDISMYTVKYNSKHIMDCDSWIENQLKQDKLEKISDTYRYLVYSPR